MPFRSASCQVLFIHILGLMMSLFVLTLPGFSQRLTSLDTTVYTIVEHQPEFPGGFGALKEYMLKNGRYPAEAQKAGIKDRVFASLIVERDGSLTDIQVLRSVGYGCDEEAVRIVKAMPRWIPGSQSGKLIRVKYNLPVLFTPTASVSAPSVDSLDCGLYTEKQPEFPGGQRALTDYLIREVRYPPEAQKLGIKGRVFTSFIIDTVGNVSNVRVLKGIGHGCDEEALRAVRSLPRWQPGCISHKRVNVFYNLPVLFGVDYPTLRKR